LAAARTLKLAIVSRLNLNGTLAEFKSFRPAQADASQGASHYKRSLFAAEPFAISPLRRHCSTNAGMSAKTSLVRIVRLPMKEISARAAPGLNITAASRMAIR
jgi:hypothetical protein